MLGGVAFGDPVPSRLLAGTSGFVIKHVGFMDFFSAQHCCIPVALLAWYVLRRHGLATWTAQANDAESAI